MSKLTRYTVEVLRSGQPRAYADTEHEYLITMECQHYGKGEEFFPTVPMGDVEAQIRRDEADRTANRMSGGFTPDQLRARQREQVIQLVKTLCQNFREKNDDDGKTGMDAHFYPTLKSLKIDPVAGTIRVLIIEPFTD